MAQREDPIYTQLEKALNLLTESSAKIDFLSSKVENKVRDLEDEELARMAQRSIFMDENLDVSALDDNSKWKSVKEKADGLQTSLANCRTKCSDLQGRIRELIAVKDTLLCESMQDVPPSNTEMLPGGTRIERMVLELTKESTECSICTENVKKQESIWSCKKCYNILHLGCAVLCMNSSKTGGKWSCPCCRELLDITAEGLRYTCFCGRVSEPRPMLTVTPHGCGKSCIRNCGNPCHPGPCPMNSASRPVGPVPINLPVNSTGKSKLPNS